MQYLNSTYTQRFNARYKQRGHLFQGRYKALLVDAEASGYFLTVSDYIHLNPVRSGGVHESAQLWRDPWSSAGWLSGMRKRRPEWLRWERVYGELGLKNWGSRGRRDYRAYLERRLEEVRKDDRRKAHERWGKIRRGWCLGSEGFIAEMKGKLKELSRKGHDQESWAGEAVEAMEEDLAHAAMEMGLKKLGRPSVKVLTRVERDLVGYWLRSQTRVSVGWIARAVGVRSVPGMRSSISRMGRLIREDKRVASLWKSLDCNKSRTYAFPDVIHGRGEASKKLASSPPSVNNSASARDALPRTREVRPNLDCRLNGLGQCDDPRAEPRPEALARPSHYEGF
jgi:hypothetical protein